MFSDLEKKLRNAGPTNVVLYFYLYFFLFIVLCGSYQFFFGVPVTPEEDIRGPYTKVVLWWIFIAVILGFLIYFAKDYHQRKNLNKLEQCRIFMLFTLFGFAVFGFIPRVFALFFSGSFVNYTTCFSLGGIFFFSIFYFTLKKSCRITITWTVGRLWKFLVIHIVVLFFENFRLVSLLFFLICVMSTIEFLHVREGKIEMTDEDDEEELKWFFVAQTVSFKCDMCHRKYNRTTRIPRILKECGHTICEECGNELLEKNNVNFVQCLYCKTSTLVNGPANLLPKNFAIMGTVELNSFQNLIDV